MVFLSYKAAMWDSLESVGGHLKAGILEEKLVALGSPKFDRILRVCKEPPAPPEAWRPMMEGKKVYFYNTSLAGIRKTEKEISGGGVWDL